MPSARLILVTGDVLEVEGQIEDVEKRLQNAARSTPGTLAWMNDSTTDEAVGVNPAHVVTLKAGES